MTVVRRGIGCRYDFLLFSYFFIESGESMGVFIVCAFK